MDKLLKKRNGDCFYKIRDNKSKHSALVLNIPWETGLKPGEYVAVAKCNNGIIKLIPKKLFKRSDYET
jgi:hypothetical protein